MSRSAVLVGVVVCGAMALGCSSARSQPDGGLPVDTGSDGGPGENACVSCIASTCTTEVSTCTAQADCAAYLACLQACPDAPGAGGIDPSCESACPAPSSSAGMAAQEALLTCRDGNAASSCAACAISGSTENPVLTQAGHCPPSMETDPCYVCEDQNCCDTEAACLGNPECKAIGVCGQACSDQACLDACQDQHPQGLQDFLNRVTCIQVFCDVCSQPTPCVSCQTTKCRNEFVACFTDPDCSKLSDCISICAFGDASCQNACMRQATPGAQTLNKALLDCGEAKCATECG